MRPLDPPPLAREREAHELGQALAAAQAGRGSLVLVAGEAGMGKTTLVRHVFAEAGVRVLEAASPEGHATPYGPLAAVLRAHARTTPDGFASCGRLAGFLAGLLPELGPTPPGTDAATLLEALRCALASVATAEPTAVFLDDLHWADNTTLEALPALAEALEQTPLLLVGAYRSDDLPRGHALRRVRSSLRRRGRLHEVTLPALEAASTAQLAERHLGLTLGPLLAARLHAHTEGVPFFVEEVAAALRPSRHLRAGPAGLELDAADLPLPESVREAVLQRMEALSPGARQALEIAAVAGPEVDLTLVADLAGSDEGLAEALAAHWLHETEPGQAAFRHALIREAVYTAIPWSQRRRLHHALAERLEARGGPTSPALAAHWLAAHEQRRGRLALMALARQWCAVHAYRDAAGAIQRALELWPPGEDESGQLDALDQLGLCAQRVGDPAEAASAWREAAEGRRLAGDLPRLAEAQRRLASLYELQRQWEPAMAARQAAAAAYAQSGQPGDAAAEHLTAANHHRSALQFQAALAQLALAKTEAAQVQRPDLTARILGLEGNVRARLGEAEAGPATVRAGLALALEHNLVGPAAEIYQRLADSLEHVGDYPAARATYLAAADYCQTNAAHAVGQVCLACMAVVLRQTGEWGQATRICRDVLAQPASAHAKAASHLVLGLIGQHRGGKWAGAARTHLQQGLETARSIELAACELLALWGLALADETRGQPEAVRAHLNTFLARWHSVEDRHYAVAPLRWAASYYGRQSARAEVHVCAEALATMASATGQPEALSGLAHALGEAALLEGSAALAAGQFAQAQEALAGLELPFDLALTQLRAGAALAAAGEREAAVERLVSAYHTARKLGAQPLAREAAQALAGLGEAVERRVGRRAAAGLAQGGLSARELEVLRQIQQGRTNRDIAQALFLSPRTVDMHVRNVLAKLDARTRTEAVGKALALGVL
jgi:DNA-binding CsgD family transcriptional regulator